jgi:peptide/nickel transport system ATP-binding protein
VRITQGVSFDLRPGERIGVVGESGCGKTATGLAILGLLPSGLERTQGQALLRGKDLLSMSDRELNRVRGRQVSMIFQEPMSALDPLFTIGSQLSETLRAHFPLGAREAKERSIEALHAVGIPSPAQRYGEYPYQLSGGMRQRAMIAIATICRPDVLIADEATTALDVTIQAQIIELLVRMSDENRMAIVFISHDLGAVAAVCSRLLTMYAGQIVEDAPLDHALVTPRHPYTAGLLAAMPNRQLGNRRLASIPGRVPGGASMPTGCRFAPRCGHVQPQCTAAPVDLRRIGDVSWARCVRAEELRLAGVGE